MMDLMAIWGRVEREEGGRSERGEGVGGLICFIITPYITVVDFGFLWRWGQSVCYVCSVLLILLKDLERERGKWG